ncbi:hypothetical protein ACPXCE_06060 [Streptomyces sp. DT24]|uniref:hypothetical protein n=1 Tax=unclassified Streptomyces TaxID=2593676 RepID=UPI0023B8E0BB|nr:hypothetical protein [Streptomyces sp. AM 4-1-1]WEH35567.1 hypothetical protein PZB75_20750 [Streptomyces sp. AM 4-1-1]
MKALLWLVLLMAVVANVSLSFGVADGGLCVALSAISGLVVLASGIALWTLREPRES